LVTSLQLPGAVAAEVVARVGEKEITLAEVNTASHGKISALQRELVATKRAALRSVIKDLLFRLAARQAELASEDFHQREVTGKAKTVSDKQVEAFYQKHRDDFTGDAAADRAAVRFYLEREAREDREKALLVELSRRFGVSRRPVDEAQLARSDDFELARVGDQPITNAMVERAAKLKLYRLRAERAREILRRVDELVYAELLSLAAKSRGMTPLELQEKLKEKAAKVTDADIDRYYRQEVLPKDPGAEKRPERIRPYLEFLAVKQAEEDLVREMRDKITVEVVVREPRPVRLDVKEAAWSPRKGPPGAAVKLVAFYNYTCRYCREMLRIYGKLEEEFQPRAQFILRHFIPYYDPVAEGLAKGAICAAKKGRFWQWHERLLESDELTQRWQRVAEEMDLAGEEFSRCVASAETEEIVAADTAEARSIGVEETPALLINGRVFSGRQGIERLRAVIKRELGAEQ